MDERKAPPIVPQDYISGVTVVDFGDLRVARGLSRRPFTGCHHIRLFYDQHERRIWCSDCESNIEAFDAFAILVERSHDMADSLKRRSEEVARAEAHALISRAAKAFDQAWRSRSTSPCCPHCNAVILPEDVAGDRLAVHSTELERARRTKKQKGLP